MYKRKSFLIFVAMLLIFLSILPFAGGFLAFNDPPVKSDVIIVLSGDRGERTQKGVELFQSGFAPYLLLSGGEVYHTITMADLMKAHAIELGVPVNEIITESRADSTYGNATFSLDIMKKNDFKSAIVVSSDYHMRRVKMIFDRAFKTSGIRLVYCASPDKAFTSGHWWQSNKSIMIVINEYIKLFGYFLGKNS